VRYWCFTENKYPEALAPTIELEGLPPHITYLCGQLEVGEQGHLHFQGYCELDASQYVSWMKKNLSPTAHFEPRYGTQEEAIIYTQKIDSALKNTWVSYGEPVKGSQGRRNDLLEIKAKLDEGATERTIAEEHFGSWVRYNKSFKQYVLLTSENNEPRVGPVKTTLIIGPSRSGKTTHVEDKLVEAGLATRVDGGIRLGSEVYIKTPQTSWWEGYNGEQCVVFEDFRANDMRLHQFFQLTDPFRRPGHTVPIKGGFVPLKADTFFVTTGVHPIDLWKSTRTSDRDWGMLKRRLTKVYETYEYFADDWQKGMTDKTEEEPPAKEFRDTGPILVQ